MPIDWHLGTGRTVEVAGRRAAGERRSEQRGSDGGERRGLDRATITLDESDHVTIDITTPKRLPESIYQNIWNSTYIFQGEHSEERLKLYLAWKVAETHKWRLLAENRGDSFHISAVIPNSHEERIVEVLKTTMDMFTEFISDLLDINICSIMLADELTGELSIKSAKGLSDEIVSRTRVSAADSVSGWVALEGKPLLLEDIDTAPHFLKQKTKQYSTNSLFSLPLKIDDKVIGVINLNNKKTGDLLQSRPFPLHHLFANAFRPSCISFTPVNMAKIILNSS